MVEMVRVGTVINGKCYQYWGNPYSCIICGQCHE